MTKLKENQLLINTPGITIKTMIENIVSWTKCSTITSKEMMIPSQKRKH